MTIKLLAKCILGMLFITLLTTPLCGQNPDFYLPDSAYFGAPSFQDVCDSEVVVTLPVYIWSDYYSDFNVFQFYWQGSGDCDTVRIFVTGSADSTVGGVGIYHNEHRISGASWSEPMFICPTAGTELFLQLVFLVRHGDSIAIQVDPVQFYFSNPFDWWRPTYMNMNTVVHVPETFVLSAGDADCSGAVTISDVVFLINYIFSGGAAPHDLNSADTDGSCTVTISDVVYLISYIFSGGDPPIPGCIL